MKFLAKTLYGLEEVLASELTSMGAERVRTLNRAVSFEGTKSLLYRANYCSRVAMSVLVPVAEFTATGRNELYQGTLAADWEKFIDPGMTYAVNAVVNSKHFDHSGFVALVVKDAVADFFRQLTGKRPSVNPSDPDLLVNVHISNDRVTISADSSGIPLYKRGYRKALSEAPLSEVLAAGLIMLSGWKADKPLYDGMCGSGTIAAEAGLIACNIAPGRFRKGFGFMKWKDYDPALFRSVKFGEEKKERRSPVKIYASDISAEAVNMARMNFEGARLGNTVTVTEADFLAYRPSDDGGMLIINPPYGKRIGGDETDKLYGSIGSALKHNYPGFSAWIFSGNPESLKSIGLKPFRKYDLLNGDIPCKFYGYELYGGSRKNVISDLHL